MLANTAGSDLHNAAAWRGLVDQTKEETVGERGRKAMGPVERNLWYAVSLGFSNAPRGAWFRVATTACVSYDHP